MKIIIAGAGEVGYHLARQISVEEHDITVIDTDQNQLDRVDSTTEVLTINGSSTSIGGIVGSIGISGGSEIVSELCVVVIKPVTVHLQKAFFLFSTVLFDTLFRVAVT